MYKDLHSFAVFPFARSAKRVLLTVPNRVAQDARAASSTMEKWPDYDKKLMAEELVSIVVQVGGRARSVISLPADSGEEEVKKLALTDEKTKKHLASREIRKTIFVKNRLINFVV